MNARDKGHVDEIITHLKRVEEEYYLNLSEEIEWLKKFVEETQTEKEYAKCFLDVFDKKHSDLPELKGQELHEFKNFLNTCQQEFGLKYWDIHPLQSKLFEKMTLLWAKWGVEHLKTKE